MIPHPAPSSDTAAPVLSGVPVWLLDVDGVLNANRAGWSAAPSRGTAYSRGLSYKMRWSAPGLDRLRALHTRGALEVRWCTTWCPWADQLERLMGLPELGRSLSLDDVADVPTSYRTKQAAALAVVETERRPLVWTDDEAIAAAGPDVHARLRAAGLPTLLLSPHPGRGLREEHLEAIEAFAARAAVSRA